MTKLDSIVDALEAEIARAGVLAVDLQQFAPSDPSMLDEERSSILVEMLRVWIEHRWQSGHPVTTSDCLAVFPNVEFSNDDIEALRFEEQRQIGIATSTRSSNRSNSRAIDELPIPGDNWGDFELLEVIGAGAFAKVYLAKQSGLAGRLVALKLTFRQSFESQWLATLQHSAIVPIYSIHQLEDVFGICMPYLGNTTLADLLRETSPKTIYSKRSWWKSSRDKKNFDGKSLLTTIQKRHDQIDTIVKTIAKTKAENEVGSSEISGAASQASDTSKDSDFDGMQHVARVRSNTHAGSPAAKSLVRCDYEQAICWIGAQLADALAYAHRQGIMHSDVKPANVLIASDGQPRLLDFNVSFRNAEQTLITSETPLGGTVAYMSPEHRLAFKVPTYLDFRSDIYSLGVVLFEMLTCRLPIVANSEEIPNPRRWNPSISPALSAIISKCLATAPEDRYQNAESLSEDLNAQFQHEPLIHQPEPSRAERFAKWCHLHPKLSSSLSVVSISAILIFGLIAGLLYRGTALEQADWSQRMTSLRRKLPNAFAMLTSLEVIPESEKEVLEELNPCLTLVMDSSHSKIDRRWEQPSGKVDEDLRSNFNKVLSLVASRQWQSEPKFINALKTEWKKTPSDSDVALDYRNDKQWGKSLPILKSNLLHNPSDFASWWLLGESANYTNDLALSLQAYTACIAIEPNALAYFNRGWVRFKNGQYDLAVEDYVEVTKLAPRLNRVHLNLALALQQLGKFNEAIRELDLAIEKDFKSVSVYRLRGMLHQLLGRNAEAIADMQLALACKPTTDLEWIDRGLIQLGFNPPGSIADFQAAIAQSPGNIDAHQKLAYVFSEVLHQPVESLHYLDRLVELESDQPSHRAARSVVNARLGNIQAAAEDLSQLEKVNVKDPMVRYQIACAYSLLAGNAKSEESSSAGAGESSIRWYKASLELDSKIADIAATDPDVQWMRNQEPFKTIQTAIQTLKASQTDVGTTP